MPILSFGCLNSGRILSCDREAGEAEGFTFSQRLQNG